MDENKKTFCPLTKEDCREKKCEWYNAYNQECAALTLTKIFFHAVDQDGYIKSKVVNYDD